MPNGEYPGGRLESLKLPGSAGAPSEPSTVTLLFARSVAYRYESAPTDPMAMPLKIAPFDAGNSVSAVVPRAPRHPVIVPSSLEKMKMSLLNLPVPLNTCPVGADTPPPGAGMVTTSPCFAPVALYSVVTPLPLSEIQNGEPVACPLVPKEIPHGLTSCGSVLAASPGMSDTRFV